MLDPATSIDDAAFAPFIDFEANSNASPPSQYEGYEGQYVTSPISPGLHSMTLTATASSYGTLSTDTMGRPFSPMEEDLDNGEFSSDESSSDQVLDSLISNIIPYQTHNGEEIFRCRDAHASDHYCDYEDKRKCNLR